MKDSVDIVLPISSGILWIIFFIVLVFFGIVSWILLHHWSYYGIKGNEKVFIKSLYFIISIMLLVAMIFLIGSYHFF